MKLLRNNDIKLAAKLRDLIRLKCLDLPDIDFDLSIMTVDDYFVSFTSSREG